MKTCLAYFAYGTLDHDHDEVATASGSGAATAAAATAATSPRAEDAGARALGGRVLAGRGAAQLQVSVKVAEGWDPGQLPGGAGRSTRLRPGYWPRRRTDTHRLVPYDVLCHVVRTIESARAATT